MPDDICCPVLELRQYTLRPGRRDELIELFDREFVEPQEAEGMRLVGQFRDLDAPDRFVWVRGFSDMPTRAKALQGFYGGPVWREHSRAANATMVDSDDVLLLRPVDDEPGFPVPGMFTPPDGLDRPPPGSTVTPSSLVVATIYHVVGDGFARFFAETVVPVLASTGAVPLARLETEAAENTFPALPVRTGENVFVWFARFDGAEQHGDHLARLERSAEWFDEAGPQLAEQLSAPPAQLRLAPTARSLLR